MSLKIQILTDKTSWFNKFNNILKKELINLGHKVKLTNQKQKLKNADISFFLSCFEIISKDYLSLSKSNIVVHASDLPEGKGWSPTSWQILEGKNKIPLTLFEANEECDGGGYYIKDELTLNGYELIDEWQEKLGNKIISMCLQYINIFDINKPIMPKTQQGKQSFYKKRNPKDSQLDINKTIKEQFNLLRIVDNEKYPAFFIIDNHKYILKITKD